MERIKWNVVSECYLSVHLAYYRPSSVYWYSDVNVSEGACLLSDNVTSFTCLSDYMDECTDRETNVINSTSR